MKQYLEAYQQHIWGQVRAELTARFAEVTDSRYALMLLRKVRQRPGENVQVYAERLMALDQEAFAGQAGDAEDRQLVGFFIDGLTFDYMKMKVMRENPATLQAAIAVATHEQNLRKCFDLRSGNYTTMSKSFDTENVGAELMEVDHLRPQFRCYKCNRRDLKAKVCRPEKHDVNAVSNFARQDRQNWYKNIVCWNCHKSGHFARDCRVK